MDMEATGASSAFLRANGHLTVEEYLQQQLEMQVSSCGVTIRWQCRRATMAADALAPLLSVQAFTLSLFECVHGMRSGAVESHHCACR
jgi:hypothetical protein